MPVAYVRQPHFVIASTPRLWHWLPPCFLSPSSSTSGSTLPRMSPSSFESRRWHGHGCSTSLYACFYFLLLSSVVSHVSAQWTASPFNPPALPLAVRSPYLNTWLQQGPNPAPASAFWPGTWTQVVSFFFLSVFFSVAEDKDRMVAMARDISISGADKDRVLTVMSSGGNLSDARESSKGIDWCPTLSTPLVMNLLPRDNTSSSELSSVTDKDMMAAMMLGETCLVHGVEEHHPSMDVTFAHVLHRYVIMSTLSPACPAR